MTELEQKLSAMQKQINDMHTLLIRPRKPHRGFVVRLVVAERRMEAHYAEDKRDFRFMKAALILLFIAIANLICGNPVMAWAVPILKFAGF